jgi:hypothetical protein
VLWSDHATILRDDRFGRIGEHPTPHPTLASARACQIDIATAGMRQCSRLEFDDELLTPAGAPVGQRGRSRRRD